MDSRSDEIFSGLKQRVKTIVSLYENEKGRNDSLKAKNLEMNERITVLENKLEELNKKYETLKIAKVLSSVPGEDVHETKLQVNRIVREIDKCIALLNR
jgi:type I site-specific restriction-modification system R (restriction) subunit